MRPAPDEFRDWIAGHAVTNPDRIALSIGSRDWTFAQLDKEVTHLARQLADAGVTSGDRVATLLHNGTHAAMLPHALLRLSATLVPLNVRLSPAEVKWQIEDSSPRLVVFEERTRASTALTTRDSIDVDALSSRNSTGAELQLTHAADHVAALIYTSGTTGQPKGAMLTIANFWWSAMGSALNLGVRDDDRWIACLPLFHVGGLSIVFRSAIYGTCAVVHDGFDATAVNSEIDHGATLISVVSVMLERMLDHRGSHPFPSTFRCVLLGGGPAPRTLLERSMRAAIPVVQTYGLTETCSQVATLSPSDAERKIGSSGKALHPNEIRVNASDSGEGELLVRGPVVMAGYFNQREATARALGDGWLHTGDIGRIDDEGFLYVLDRRDDLIITGGENVYPAEVESVLLGHSSVAEAAVIGLEDQTWGQRVVAVVRASGELNEDELVSHCRTLLAGYKVPREFRIVTDPLPRTASGKIRRALLRESITSS